MNLMNFPADLEKKLNLMAEHVLSDQREDNLNINLKFVSSSEMKKLNKEFRKKSLIQMFYLLQQARKFKKSLVNLGILL